ncbi:MAG TPA: AlkA N-terminal domain-containing protein, partial [Acidimicrobiales bacterium]
ALRLSFRRPFEVEALLGFLGARAVAGVEEYGTGTYRRTLRLPHGGGMVALRDGGGHIAAHLQLDDWRDLAPAVQRCRRLLDLDADPTAVDSVLGADPILAPLVATRPGLRVPGAVEGAEVAVRAIVGQQVSVVGARTLTGELVRRLGKPLTAAEGTITHQFPEPAALADSDPSSLGLPVARGRALVGLARSVEAGDLALDPGADREEATRSLLDQPGIGRWTAGYVAMRALGDPDVLLETDAGTRRACGRLGLPRDPQLLTAHAERWRPWRSYALQHLWASLAPAPRPKETNA